jgi:purine-binding chemotaxis protein CheW
MKLVIFNVGNHEYGVDVQQVREVIRLPEVIPVPDVPYWIEGIMDLRGEVIPVISLHKKLGLETGAPTDLNRILIAHLPDRPFGLVVDAVTGVIPLEARDLDRADDLVNRAGYLQAVARIGSRLVLLIDLPAVLSDTEAVRIRSAGETVMLPASDGSQSMDPVTNEETR